MLKSKLTKAVIAVAGLLLLATAGYAAIPGANGVISACRDSKGALKVIDAEAGQACNSNQQLLTWNQQGPAGPQGAPGVSGHEIVTQTSLINSVAIKEVLVVCPASKVVVGGGGKAFTTGNGGEWNPIHVAITWSYPRDWGTSQGWSAHANETADLAANWGLRAYAICADVT